MNTDISSPPDSGSLAGTNSRNPISGNTFSTLSAFRQTLCLVGLFIGCLLLFGLIGAGIARLLPSIDHITTLH
ncbi:MAG: hypothetical protein K2O01_03640, partial [Bacteroidales bacterium]|nr:hypothetical protein [Bacteroidales bacterium]